MKSKILCLILVAVFILASCNASTETSLPENGNAESETVSDKTEASDEDSIIEDESNPAESTETESQEPEDSSVPEDSSAPEDSSVPEESSKTEESSKVEETSKNEVPSTEVRVSVKYASFSEKPYAVVFGKCDEGATVHVKCGDKTYSSESWHGWYSVRFLSTSSKAEITVTQTIDGKQVGAGLKQTIYPVTPNTSEGVVAGDNFQFFYQKCLKDFEHTNLYSSGVLNNFKTRVAKRVNEAKKTNTEIIYMVVPAAMTIYPELVPDQYKQGSGDSRLDQTIKTASAAGATVIDLREVFEQHKNDEYPLYFKLDSHWTDYGAYIAYTELFNHISQKFPAATPRPMSDFNWNGDYYKSGDMPVYLSIISQRIYESKKITNSDILEYGWERSFKSNVKVNSAIKSVPRYRADVQMVYSNEVTYGYTFENNNSKLPSCMVMHDSFGTQIFDILAERMDTTYYPYMWDYTYDNSYVNSEKPDYVIYIVAEWNLDSIVYK